jgi:uncharacterized membrane protein
MTNEQSHKVHLSPEDQERLRELRAQKPARNVPKLALTPGAMLADRVAETVGSWRFIIIQSVLLGIWIILNMIAFINHWDPYPFILLNLVLSFQAAYAAPIIMMSQNRQSEIDRRHAEHDYRINVKAELEIELLHNKIDALREQEILQLLNIIQRLSALSLSETQSGWQVESNWVMLLVDERCLQPDLVGADRIVPVASVAASRDLDASSSTQRAAA